MSADTEFKYRLFRATTGVDSFWRWEVYRRGRGDPTESGIIYGSTESAKATAMAAIARLSAAQLKKRKSTSTTVRDR